MKYRANRPTLITDMLTWQWWLNLMASIEMVCPSGHSYLRKVVPSLNWKFSGRMARHS